MFRHWREPSNSGENYPALAKRVRLAKCGAAMWKGIDVRASRRAQREGHLNGQLVQVRDATKPVATLTYTNGELASILYPSGTGSAGNGSALSSIARDPRGTTTGITWTIPGQTSISNTVVRSQSGRIVQDTITRGSTMNVSMYSYDAAGRLVSAAIPRHQLSYGFAISGGCGQSTLAGLNGNRTSSTDVKDGGAPITTSFCYGRSDRLTSTTVTNALSGANPVAAGMSGAALVYDGHGNATTLADHHAERSRSISLASLND